MSLLWLIIPIISYVIMWLCFIPIAHELYLYFFYENKSKWFNKTIFYGCFSPLSPIIVISILIIMLWLICKEKILNGKDKVLKYFLKRKHDFGL
jgi:uncharacterized membrane protein